MHAIPQAAYTLPLASVWMPSGTPGLTNAKTLRLSNVPSSLTSYR